MTQTPLPGATSWSAQMNDCYARLEHSELTIGNDCFERRWQLRNGLPWATSFLDKRNDRQWTIGQAPVPSLAPAAALAADAPIQIESAQGPEFPVEQPSLRIIIAVTGAATDTLRYQFKVFSGVAGVTGQLLSSGTSPTPGAAVPQPLAGMPPTGVEHAPRRRDQELPRQDVMECVQINPLHLRFIQVELQDRTDVHDNLVFQRQWLLHPSESRIRATGNIFVLEDRLTGDGLAFIKLAPLPHARPVQVPADVELRESSLLFLGHGAQPGAEGYPSILLAYTGRRTGRIAAIQDYQRKLRPYVPGRDGLLLSNTWGDRSKDARVNEPFLSQEIEAAARLGVDVVQIDDGWMKGVTSNSIRAEKTKGAWGGFYAADPNFWDVDTERFPSGLDGIVKQAARHKMRFGLWFSPDSANDYAMWEKDAQVILDLHRNHHIDYIKIDGVHTKSMRGEQNLRRFFNTVLEQSGGKVVFDLDVTAGTRPSYFGLIHVGPIFVENRYTDWHRYFPHSTLRNLWTLAQYVDPMRLRMELLNNTRHTEIYPDDPLAPASYSPAYLFATVMFANPLGWFEVSNLPEDYIREVAPLVKIWKKHRQAMFAGHIIPIGHEPDGTTWTGFASRRHDGQGGYLLILRELNDQPTCSFPDDVFGPGPWRIQRLAGNGSVKLRNGQIEAKLPDPRSFVFARVTR